MVRFAVLLFSLLAALIAVPSAQAQWDPGASAMLGQGYGMNALSQSVMSNTFNSSGKGGSGGSSKPKKAKPRKPTKAQLAKLRFKPTAARTEANLPHISAVLLATCPPDREGCPIDHATIIANLERDNRVRFRANIREVIRGSDRNVADAVTTFLVMAWAAQRPTLELTTAQAQGARATAADLRNQLALSAPARRLSDAKKQRLMETLGALAQHSLALRHMYLQLGRTDQADKLTRRTFTVRRGKRVRLTFTASHAGTYRLDIRRHGKRVKRLTGRAKPGRNTRSFKVTLRPGRYRLALTRGGTDAAALRVSA